MRDLFQELYNKVLSLFNASKEEISPTKDIAVNRLKTLLMQDRAGFSERAIQMMKEELVNVVSKYMEIETENFELQIDAADENKTVLNLAIPVVRPKTDDEIDDIIKKEEEKTKEKVQEIVKEIQALIKDGENCSADEIDANLIDIATKKVQENSLEDTKEEQAEPDKLKKELEMGSENEPANAEDEASSDDKAPDNQDKEA